MTNLCHCLCAAAGAATKYKKKPTRIAKKRFQFQSFLRFFLSFFGDWMLDAQIFVVAICIINVDFQKLK